MILKLRITSNFTETNQQREIHMNRLWASFEEDAKKYSIDTQIDTFDYSINISLQYNYLFTETPKVACSTIKTILQKMELNNPDLYRSDFEDIHERAFSPLLKPSQIGPLDKLFKGDSLYKFCFSRNPYSRLLSVYIDKIRTNKPEKRSILHSLGKDPEQLEQDILFEDFVQVVCKQNVLQMNSHWRTQYYQTFQDNITYDFMGKIENFNDDIKTVLTKINPDYQRFMSTEKRHATNADTLLTAHYTPDLIKLVQQTYEKDFHYFGYDLDFQKALKS